MGSFSANFSHRSKYVSASTKKDILWHLTARVKKEDEALVVHSHIFHHLLELEDRIDISYWLFSLCGRLAQHHDIKGETYGSPLASVRPVYVAFAWLMEG
jgi:hypothetical protein